MAFRELHMYIVHMKRVTASDARKNWFRLLDEVLGGEVVCIDRNGRRILIRMDDEVDRAEVQPPDYAAVLRAPGAESADAWRWSWEGPEEELELIDDAGA